MLGFLITLLFTLGATGIGLMATRRFTAQLDPAARVGICGLIALGFFGWITLPIGLLPGGLKWGLGVVGFLGLAGLGGLYHAKSALKFSRPEGPGLIGPVVISLAMLIPLLGVLAPSDTLDWDSLAYHLAVPKIWLQAGQIQFVSFIHHSNFPFAIDNLYIWGLSWGGQSGAKAFSWCFTALGALTLFGLARGRYGATAGAWTAAAFTLTPMVLWLSGTGYVDVSNGLYTGLGILFAALWLSEPEERKHAILCGIFLGLAAGSKYTGLQTIFIVLLCLGLGSLLARNVAVGAKTVALVGGLALVIACPWYIRNVVNTGNPVYPFFFSKLGGKNWDAFSERIYREEQQTFGAGRAMSGTYTENPLEITRFGHAVLGLAYQPGRYVNPTPTQGMGVPVGSLGAVGLAALLLWAASGRMTRFEAGTGIMVALSLGLWFFLSQQSRYITGLMIPLFVLAGGAVAQLAVGKLLAGLVVVQGAVSLWITKTMLVDAQLPVVVGKISPSEFQAARVGFFEPAAMLNEAAKDGKVALFDEVFGYFLDVPYFWANPGHTTELGYDQMQNGDDLVAALKKIGITHAYLNLGIYPSSDPAFQRWVAAMGLQGPAQPYEGEERAQQFADLRNKWKVLVAEGLASGKLRVMQSFGRRLVIAVE